MDLLMDWVEVGVTKGKSWMHGCWLEHLSGWQILFLRLARNRFGEKKLKI